MHTTRFETALFQLQLTPLDDVVWGGDEVGRCWNKQAWTGLQWSPQAVISYGWEPGSGWICPGDEGPAR